MSASFFGAISTFVFGERLGRKKTFLIGVTIMSIGAILQTCAFSVAQMIVARLITGEYSYRYFYSADFDVFSAWKGIGNGCVVNIVTATYTLSVLEVSTRLPRQCGKARHQNLHGEAS